MRGEITGQGWGSGRGNAAVDHGHQGLEVSVIAGTGGADSLGGRVAARGPGEETDARGSGRAFEAGTC